jgi:hypothetical protein
MAHEIVIYGPRAASENSIVDLKVLDSGHSKHTTNFLDFQTFYKKISAFHGHDFYTPPLFIVLSISQNPPNSREYLSPNVLDYLFKIHPLESAPPRLARLLVPGEIPTCNR